MLLLPADFNIFDRCVFSQRIKRGARGLVLRNSKWLLAKCSVFYGIVNKLLSFMEIQFLKII